MCVNIRRKKLTAARVGVMLQAEKPEQLRMANIGYVFEKLRIAVEALASGEGSFEQRLWIAWISALMRLNSNDADAEIAEDLNSLLLLCRRHVSEGKITPVEEADRDRIVGKLTALLAAKAKAARGHVIHVICHDPINEGGEVQGMSFLAIAAFLPRVGDKIFLDNGRICEVESSVFKAVKTSDASGTIESISLIPNVGAVLLDEDFSE